MVRLSERDSSLAAGDSTGPGVKKTIACCSTHTQNKLHISRIIVERSRALETSG